MRLTLHFTEEGRLELKLRLNTTGSTFLVSKDPEPALDYNTQAPKIDKEGRPIYIVQLVKLDEQGGAEVMGVKVPGKPVGLSPKTYVNVLGLTASPWSKKDGNSGISFEADSIEAAGTTPKAGSN